MVDTNSNTIFLPENYFDSKLKKAEIRKIKALINHECAHLLYLKMSSVYNLRQFSGYPEKTLRDLRIVKNILATIDDICIEIWLERDFAGFREDFTFLIEQVWQETLSNNPEQGHGLRGDFSKDLMGSFF